MSPLNKICAWLASQQRRVVDLQGALTAIPALGPENGGQGEQAKAAFVENCLTAAGATNIRHFNSPDPRVESGIRPNLVAWIPGAVSRTLWLFGHLDVVPAGDRKAWESDPWRACVKDGMVYGRGVEDNQQAICSMLLLAESLKTIRPHLGLGLVFMSDEELGSAHGLSWILKNAADLFKKEDLYIVPDGGSPDASMIEIAEKAQLWLKFTVNGRQCHASTPEAGINALVAASRLILALDNLEETFSACDPLFNPPRSTFTPTKHEANVDAVNILPGRDVFFLDCRLLPCISQAEVLAECQKLANTVARISGVEITIEVEHSSAATSTSKSSPIVGMLQNAIEAVYGVAADTCGIGGATVASFLREAGLPAVVWACLENTCHQPNERSSITATLKDAAVFAQILMQGASA